MFYNVQEQEEFEFTYTSESEWDRAEASERGYHNPDSEWILTNRDVWHKNPYFTGTPTNRHPEDDNEALQEDLDAEGEEDSLLRALERMGIRVAEMAGYDDIPF